MQLDCEKNECNNVFFVHKRYPCTPSHLYQAASTTYHGDVHANRYLYLKCSKDCPGLSTNTHAISPLPSLPERNMYAFCDSH